MRIESAEQEYLNDVFGLADPELAEIRAELHRQKLDFMSISGFEARILQFLLRVSGVRKVVEVGTLFGFSAVAMAKALPADGLLITLEKSTENFGVATSFFNRFAAAEKVRALLGDAAENLATIEREGPFDLIFIDADKAAYCKYLDWAEKNVKRGGLIVGDNTFLWGNVYDQPREEYGANGIAAMKEFNRRLADTSRYNSTLIPTVEGMTVAQKLF